MEQQALLAQAETAWARRDYLRAMHLGMRAARSLQGRDQSLCDAYVLLALTSLELEMPETALAYAVGANLAACRLGDARREGQAAATLELVTARYPYLRDGEIALMHH